MTMNRRFKKKRMFEIIEKSGKTFGGLNYY